MLTADVELAERAKSYEFEYILIVNNNTSNKAKKKEKTLDHIVSIEEEKIVKEEQTINTEKENLIENDICEEENLINLKALRYCQIIKHSVLWCDF